MDIDGSNQKRLTYHSGYDLDPVWSPALDNTTEGDGIQIVKEWLNLLKSEQADVSQVFSFISSEFNFDGQILSEKELIRKNVLEIRKVFTEYTTTTKFTDFQRLDKAQVEQFMSNSKHSRKYKLSKDKIESMVLFYLHAVLKNTTAENVDGVFIGFDSSNKIISWFD